MTYNYDSELVESVALIPLNRMDDPVAARVMAAKMLGLLNVDVDTSGLDIDERLVPGLNADPDITVRIYTPKDRRDPVPALLFMHGGGFVVGDLDTEHMSAVDIARKLGVLLVSVDYRLAPESPFPAALNDCYAALSWLHNNAEDLCVDRDRIGIYGQSAGGGLAAALALMARDKDGPSICFQCLGMPELDDRVNTVSMQSFTDTPMWHRANAELSWQYYLGDQYQPGADDVPVYAAPARVADASGLPPAYITAMEFDPLRDEDVKYALKLMECGVPVELHTFPGTFHGSSMLSHAQVSKRQQQEMMAVLSRGLSVQHDND